MSLFNLFSGEKMLEKAMPYLRNFMVNKGIRMISLTAKPVNENAKVTEEDFEVKLFTEPVVVITVKDLEMYQAAVNKCLEHDF